MMSKKMEEVFWDRYVAKLWKSWGEWTVTKRSQFLFGSTNRHSCPSGYRLQGHSQNQIPTQLTESQLTTSRKNDLWAHRSSSSPTPAPTELISDPRGAEGEPGNSSLVPTEKREKRTSHPILCLDLLQEQLSVLKDSIQEEKGTGTEPSLSRFVLPPWGWSPLAPLELPGRHREP